MNTYKQTPAALAYDIDSNATGSVRAIADTFCVDCEDTINAVSIIAPLDAPQYLPTGSAIATRNGYTRPGTIIRD